MTTQLNVKDLGEQIRQRFPEAVVDDGGEALVVKPYALADVARHCFDTPELAFDFLVGVTGVDYIDHFELVYHLVSIKHNHAIVLKTKTESRESPSVPSVTGIWEGAMLQEREVYDLMGIAFEGHPDLKRIMLWEGFPGHPHRKDFTTA